MLSKVAERVYWTARYLERVESTARMVSIYDKLLFDLPRGVNIGWYNLIVINGIEADFSERYTARNERNVIQFLIGDRSNLGSIVSSLSAIRENIRTTRDVIPADIWELINELSIYVNDHLQQGLNRRRRHEFLDEVIKGCQQILGLAYACMPRDAVWEFMRLGRYVERADMTTRILDAGVAAITHLQDDEFLVNSEQIILGNILRSLSADQSYRRTCRATVSGKRVVAFLLEDREFPKTINYCIHSLIGSCQHLPNATGLLKELDTIKNIVPGYKHLKLGDSLRDYLNSLQIYIGKFDASIAQAWFPKFDIPVLDADESLVSKQMSSETA